MDNVCQSKVFISFFDRRTCTYEHSKHVPSRSNDSFPSLDTEIFFPRQRGKNRVADPRATRQKSNFGKYSKHEKCHRWGRGERMEFPFVSLSRNTWDGIIIALSAHPKIYFSRDHPTFLF